MDVAITEWDFSLFVEYAYEASKDEDGSAQAMMVLRAESRRPTVAVDTTLIEDRQLCLWVYGEKPFPVQEAGRNWIAQTLAADSDVRYR